MEDYNITPQNNNKEVSFLKNPKNRIRIILLGILFIIIIILIVVLVYKNKSIFTEKEQLKALQELSDSSINLNLTDQQKADLLKDLSAGGNKTQPSSGLNEQQKLDLLKNLNSN